MRGGLNEREGMGLARGREASGGWEDGVWVSVGGRHESVSLASSNPSY